MGCPAGQVGRGVKSDVRRRAVCRNRVQGKPPNLLFGIPHHMRIPECLMMINLFVVDRSVYGFVPVDLPIGVKSILRMFFPMNQISTSGLHDLLVSERIIAILTGVEKKECAVMFDNTSGPDTFPVRPLGIGPFH